MLIGLLSDTHIPDHAKELPPQIKEAFHGVDLILHAGDVYKVSVLDELECLAPILVAAGDDDFEVLGDRRVKKEHVLTVEGVTICLIHQYGVWSWPGDKTWSWDRPEKPPDVIVFGHTHRATLENHADTIRINPGSPTFPHYKHELGTVGLLTISSGKAEAQIIKLQ